MIRAGYFRSALLCKCALVQAVAQESAAETADQPAPVEEIVVTGSRVITSGNDAPTLVTTLSANKLLETTPSSVVDALKNQPLFLPEPAVRNTAAQPTQTRLVTT